MHDPTPLHINVLVAAVAPTHGQCGVHVHVMTREVEADQQLEDD